MNLTKLFESQKILRDRIGYNEPDCFEKLVLALLVEIGECANEWRGFKFWSKDQKPRTKIICTACHGIGEVYQPIDGYQMTCPHCDGEGVENSSNPLLEEYVDGLHFVLEIGLEHEIDKLVEGLAIEEIKFSNITQQFTELFKVDWHMYEDGDGGYYHEGLEMYLSLGEMLGFTWEEIEHAYFAKNQINHERQENGY